MNYSFHYGTWERTTFAFFVASVVLAVVGLVGFPDAPIRTVGASFLGKFGQPHSAQSYWWFGVWECTILVVGLVTFVLAVGAQLRRRRQIGSSPTPTPPA